MSKTIDNLPEREQVVRDSFLIKCLGFTSKIMYFKIHKENKEDVIYEARSLYCTIICYRLGEITIDLNSIERAYRELNNKFNSGDYINEFYQEKLKYIKDCLNQIKHMYKEELK